MSTPDPLPQILADRITGLCNLTNSGPFLRLDAKPSDDGREISVDVVDYDFDTIGNRTFRIVLHLSPQMPVDTDQATNGAADPVIAAPTGGAA